MILDMARELGVALAESSEFVRMKNAQKALEQNEAIVTLINELHAKRTALVGLLQSNESEGALALELTNDVERLQGQLSENPVFSEMIEAESAFSDLIQTVDNEINACIGSTSGGCGGDCGGDCGACSGCQH